ncbi:hypothetical protein NQZ79_g2693 [Umbelopsis isabellina]|nr:hypothetical protein NQZ79_g2693 [Umbelopsis isabellina]
MFKNPMLIMMGVSAVMLFALPKMMSNINPEDMEDFNKAQVDAQKMMSDVGLGKFLGGGGGSGQGKPQTKK